MGTVVWPRLASSESPATKSIPRPNCSAHDLFEADQARRQRRRPAAPAQGLCAILTGRFFDDRGNRMNPTHSNKRGVRYRHYVSHAILHKHHARA
jgi:site-specific DNA recombinase